MKSRLPVIFGSVLCLSLLFTPLGAAQRPASHSVPEEVTPVPSLSAADEAERAAADLAYPGLSFRLVETLGVTGEAYPADAQHLNGPDAMAVDESGHLYVVENSGARVLKYQTSDSANVWTIGKAGLHLQGDYTFNSPTDVELDSDGHVWISDRHSVAEYDANGTLLQEFPADDPGDSGSDNVHFDEPRGITFDTTGRMYVSDRYNHRVQVYTFTVGGTPVYSTTIGVTGVPGSDNDHFDEPAQIVTGSSDRLYVTDSQNNRVQRCEYAAGWSCSTFDDGGLNFPFGLGIDENGDTLYISDNNNGRVKACDTTADTCSVFTTDVNRPTDIVVDASGAIYISDYGDSVVREYDADGNVLQILVGESGVPYTTDGTYFNEPYGIAVDADGNVYVGTEAGYRFVKLNADGTSGWSVGTPGVFGDSNQQLGSFWAGARGVAVAPDGTAYAADPANGRIQIFDADGDYTTTLGGGTTGEYQFAAPEGVAVDDAGMIYVADTANHRVQIYDSTLTYQATLGERGVSGSDNDHFDSPDNVTIDADGNVYVADEGNNRVQVFDGSGNYVRTIGSGKLGSPQDVAVDAQGRVYVADIYNNRVQVFAADGGYLTTIGGEWNAGPGQFRTAAGVAVDDRGMVYVTDVANHRVQVFALHTPGWRQANVNGFGNLSNWSVWSVGVFSDTLYASTGNFNGGSELYRLSAGTWEQVASGGFGDSANVAVNQFATFNDQLYAGTWADSGGGQIWRSPSGDSGSWSEVVSDGFGDTANIEVMSLQPFDGHLYAGTWTDSESSEIWRSASGNAASWTQVVSSTVFGESNNSAILSMAVFSDALYAATANETSGGEVWRTDDGTTWNQVNGDGFDIASNTHAVTLEVFDGQLYAGTRNDSGTQVWRSADGTTWNRVANGGFGNTENTATASLITARDDLYAIVDNRDTGTQVWRSPTGDSDSWRLVVDTGFGTGAVSQTDWEGVATVWNDTLFVGTYTYGNGGGRLWELMRQIFLPLVIRS